MVALKGSSINRDEKRNQVITASSKGICQACEKGIFARLEDENPGNRRNRIGPFAQKIVHRAQKNVHFVMLKT